MFQSVDLYLGIFLIISGVGIALLNLRSVFKGKSKFSNVLISQNMFLMCIGLAFLLRAVYSLHPANMNMEEFDMRLLKLSSHFEKMPCGFPALLLGYGPLVISMVNSFLSLIINSYMHYQIAKEENNKDNVQDLREDLRSHNSNLNTFVTYLKSNYKYITIFLQWILPIVTALLLYPMNVNEVSINEMRNLHDSCISLLDLTNADCQSNYSMPIHKYIPNNITDLLDHEFNNNETEEINVVLKKVFNILDNYNNNTDFFYVQTKSARTPKSDDCMKICIIKNKNILVYMVILAFVCFFVPITISLVILTKIYTMKIKKGTIRKYITQDVLYNVVFWSPVLFDTFLSLILCSFSMQGTRTSLFNIIANLYQAMKNFMNIKHFNDNTIVPE